MPRRIIIINITTLITCCFRFEKLKIPSLQPYIEDRYSYLLHHFGREVEVISKVSTQTSVGLSCSGKGLVVVTIWVKGFSKASESSVDCCYPLYEPIGALRIFESDVGETAFAFDQLQSTNVAKRPGREATCGRKDQILDRAPTLFGLDYFPNNERFSQWCCFFNVSALPAEL